MTPNAFDFVLKSPEMITSLHLLTAAPIDMSSLSLLDKDVQADIGRAVAIQAVRFPFLDPAIHLLFSQRIFAGVEAMKSRCPDGSFQYTRRGTVDLLDLQNIQGACLMTVPFLISFLYVGQADDPITCPVRTSDP